MTAVTAAAAAQERTRHAPRHARKAPAPADAAPGRLQRLRLAERAIGLIRQVLGHLGLRAAVPAAVPGRRTRAGAAPGAAALAAAAALTVTLLPATLPPLAGPPLLSRPRVCAGCACPNSYRPPAVLRAPWGAPPPRRQPAGATP